MNKVEINEILFKKIINGCKHSVARDDSRPVLKNIQLNIQHDKIVAYSLDGYRASKITAQLTEDYGEFSCTIKPIAFKISKKGMNDITIECDKDFAHLEIITTYGKQRFSFKQSDTNFVDVSKIFNDAKDYDIKTCLNARYISEAAKAIQSSVDNHNCMTIHTKQDTTKPVIIVGESEGIKNEQLILPIFIKE